METEPPMSGKFELAARLAELFYKWTSIRVKPEQVHKMADARRYEALTMGDTLRELSEKGLLSQYDSGPLKIKALPTPAGQPPVPIETVSSEIVNYDPEDAQALLMRSVQRQLHDSIKKQARVETIIGGAAMQYTEGERVSSEKIDDEWANRFYRYAEDVTTEEMQMLWSKVLSGEVKQPGSFSYRFLEVLRNITQQEAELFEEWAKYCIVSWVNGPSTGFVVKNVLDDNVFNYSNLLLLSRVGLTTGYETDLFVLKTTDVDSRSTYLCGDIVLRISRPARTPYIALPAYPFTTEGVQLARLLKLEPDKEYLWSVAKQVEEVKGVKVEAGQYVGEDGANLYWRDVEVWIGDSSNDQWEG